MIIEELVALLGFDIKDSGKASEFTNTLDGIEKKLKSVGETAQRIGRGMSTYITAPLLGVAGAAFKVGSDFETTMSRIEGLVGVPAEKVAKLRDEVIALSRETGESANSLGDALYFVTSSGIDADNAMSVVEQAAKGAAAGLGEASVLADALTSAMNAYGPANLSAAEAMDTLVAAVREGKAEPNEMAGALGRVIPVASEMKVGFDEVSGAIGAMSLTGSSAEEAATALRSVMTTLQQPTKQTSDALSEMGLNASDLRRQLREEGLLSTLNTLRESAEGNEEAMGAVFGNVRALTGALALTGESAESTARIMDGTANSAGELDDAYKNTETTARDTARAWAAINSALIELSDVLIPKVVPLITTFTEKLIALSDWFGNLDSGAQDWILTIGGALAAGGPILWGIGKMLSVFGAILPAIKLIGTAILAVFTVAGAPLVLAVAAVAGLIAVWWNYHEEISQILSDVGEWFVSLKDRSVEALQPIFDLWDRIVEKITGAIDKIKEFVGAAQDVAGGAVGAVSGAGSRIASGVSNVWGGLFGDAGEEAGEQLAEGIERSAPAVDEASESVTEGAAAYLPQSRAEKGPLRELDRMGRETVKQWLQGMLDFDVGPLMQRIAQNAFGEFRQAGLAAGMAGIGGGSIGNIGSLRGGGGGGGTTNLTGDKAAKARQIMDRLVKVHGWTPEAAASAVGQAIEESALNPLASGDQGTSRGLFQWRLDRQTKMRAFAARTGRDWTDWTAQVDFFNQERKGRSSAEAGWHQVRDIEQGNRIGKMFERYAGPLQHRRAAHARGVLEDWQTSRSAAGVDTSLASSMGGRSSSVNINAPVTISGVRGDVVPEKVHDAISGAANRAASAQRAEDVALERPTPDGPVINEEAAE